MHLFTSRERRDRNPRIHYSPRITAHRNLPIGVDLKSQGILLAEPVGIIPNPQGAQDLPEDPRFRLDRPSRWNGAETAVHFKYPPPEAHRSHRYRTYSSPASVPTVARNEYTTNPRTSLPPKAPRAPTREPRDSARVQRDVRQSRAPIDIPNRQEVVEKVYDCTCCHPNFRFSKCTARKKAVCIGINYIGQSDALKGCINDAQNIRSFLSRTWGYRSEDILVLTDDSKDPRLQPTRKNIIAAAQWLVKDAKEHDALFFHYSGHGSQTPDTSGDELDGYDEVIYPVDHKAHGFIKDDELHKILVTPLPPGCRLTALFDSCHSGTVLDLTCAYTSHGRCRSNRARTELLRRKACPADVISFSACKDGQTAADTFRGGMAVGAMSKAFTTALDQNPRQSYKDLLLSLRSYLIPKYDQTPQMGSSHHLDVNARFVI